MASVMLASSPPEDEEDEDYDPFKDNTCENEDKLGKKTSDSGRGRRLSSSTNTTDNNHEDDMQAVLHDPQTEAQRTKVNSLWESLQSKTKAIASNQANKSTFAKGSLAAFCKPVTNTKKKTDKSWMRALGLSSGGVAKMQTEKKDTQALAAAALAAARTATSLAQNHGKVVITETRNFAGSEIQVTKTVAADSKLGKKSEGPNQKSGLDTVLDTLQGPKKLSLMDKTRKDWTVLKQEDKELEEELDVHVKSNETYLEKVDFLKRAELREYEKERDARLGGDVRTRGRL